MACMVVYAIIWVWNVNYLKQPKHAITGEAHSLNESSHSHEIIMEFLFECEEVIL